MCGIRCHFIFAKSCLLPVMYARVNWADHGEEDEKITSGKHFGALVKEKQIANNTLDAGKVKVFSKQVRDSRDLG